ncbi:MAG: hypothetical protein ACI4T5_11020 [Prevotella sp.]
MAKTKKVIKVPKGTVPLMSKELGVSRQAVYDALSFRCGSVQAAKIRKDAIEVYGGFIGKAFFNY